MTSYAEEIDGDLNVKGTIYISGTPAVVMIASQSNCFVGNAGNITTTASALTAMGKGAMASIGGADGNTAFGYSAMTSLVSGGGNTALGDRALNNATSSIDMTAIGSRALFSNLDGVGCTAIGVESQYNNLHGGNNTSIGDISLYSNTTGYGSAAVGYACMNGNVDGYQNCGFGQSALYTNQSGSQNTAMGYGAMQSADGGDRNVAMGMSALLSATTSDNTALGFTSFYGLTNGDRNTGVGTYAGASITTGSRNVFVGYSAGNDPGQFAAVNDSIAIGHGAFTTADNQVVLGPATITQTILQGTLHYGIGPSLISSPAAGVHQLGGPDSAAPISQTIRAQSVADGNVDMAGADMIIAGSCGTGNANGGAVRIQVSPPAASGSSQNPLADAVVVSRTRETTFMQNIYLPDISGLFWTGRTGLTAPGDNILRIRNNAGDVFTDLSVPMTNSLQLGGMDTSSPNPHTLKVQSVAADTADTVGADFTIQASSGTGTGQGGAIVFQTAPAGSTGSGSNAYATAMVVAGNGSVGINTSAPGYAFEVAGSFGFAPGESVNPIANGDVTFELTNDTTFTIRARGSDGIVRTGVIPLA